MANVTGAAVYASQPPTEAMQVFGFGFGDVVQFAEDAVALVTKHGPDAVDVLKTGFRLFTAITGKDFAGIMVELNKAVVDVTALVKAIREEFGLPE